MTLTLCRLGFYCLLESLSFQCSDQSHQGLLRLFECLSFQCSCQLNQGFLRLFECLSLQCSYSDPPRKGVHGAPLAEAHQSDCFDASHPHFSMREPRPGTCTVPSFVIGSLGKGDLYFFFLGVLSGRPGRRSTSDLRRLERPGERLNICDLIPSSMGERAGRGGSRTGDFPFAFGFNLPLPAIMLFGSSRLASAVGFYRTRDVPSCRLTR